MLGLPRAMVVVGDESIEFFVYPGVWWDVNVYTGLGCSAIAVGLDGVSIEAGSIRVVADVLGDFARLRPRKVPLNEGFQVVFLGVGPGAGMP